MSQGHVNRGMMLVKAMKKADRAAFFEEVADNFCVDCGEEDPDEDHEDECPAADDGDEDDGDELVFDVLEAAKEVVDGGKEVEGGILVPPALMQSLGGAIEALKVAEAEDDEDGGDDGDPEDDEDDADEDEEEDA